MANDEHTVLWLLSHLKHPNMLELLGSYTFQGVHNFLFPMVEGGNLKHLLQSSMSIDAPWSRTDYFSALAGLSSAVQHLHNYRHPTIGDALMGCHHDIKPANVLVRGKALVLADFGLSTIREGEDSKTQFKTGRGIYKAPECEDYSNGFHPGTIGRSMDIWALGCIIMEVMTHLHWGPEGVAEFKTGRKTVIPGVITTYAFHGGKSPNVGVEKWLEKLEALGSFSLPVAREAKRMLSIAPVDRPAADHVSSTLSFAQACSMFQNIRDKLERYYRDGATWELHLEILRYSLLGAGCSLDHPEGAMATAGEAFSKRIIGCIDVLSEFDAILNSATGSSWRASFAPLLGVANNRFSDLLTPEERKRVSTQLLQSFLDLNDDDQKIALGKIASSGEQSEDIASDSDVGKQLAAMQMLSLMDQSEGDYDKGLRLRPERLINRRPFQAGEIGMYLELDTENRENVTPVLIEWITYTGVWIGHQGTELFNRIGKVTQLLRSLSALQLFPTLHCKGFFHEMNRHRFGLVYELPMLQRITLNDKSNGPCMISLSQLIEGSKNVRRRPSLERIFALALNLANALLAFHNVGWLHKNLSSFCVVFSSSSNSPDAVRTEDFYVCGFNHSRPDSPDEYSNGLCQRPDTDILYQHPDSRRSKNRYCRGFDRYSLGIMLLELGLWKPVHEMTEGMKSGDQKRTIITAENALEFKRHILQQFVPLLDQRMGSHFRAAVECCLVAAEDTQDADLVAFDLLCVDRLRKCCSGYA
jgi:serine/threonine protein kinase